MPENVLPVNFGKFQPRLTLTPPAKGFRRTEELAWFKGPNDIDAPRLFQKWEGFMKKDGDVWCMVPIYEATPVPVEKT